MTWPKMEGKKTSGKVKCTLLKHIH